MILDQNVMIAINLISNGGVIFMADGVFYILAVLAAIAFRYNLQMNSTTLEVRKLLSDTDSPKGFQDAITPPVHTQLTILTWGAIVILISTSSYFNAAGLVTFATFVFATFITGIVIQDKMNEHFTSRIYRSMTNRHVDFIKNNDTVRADAIQELIHKFQQRVFKECTKEGKDVNQKHIVDIVLNGYGKFLEEIDISPLSIWDVSHLPFDKKTILKAIQMGILEEGRSSLEHLKTGAILLAYFQEGIGKEPLYRYGKDFEENLLASREYIRTHGKMNEEHIQELANMKENPRWAEESVKVLEEMRAICFLLDVKLPEEAAA